MSHKSVQADSAAVFEEAPSLPSCPHLSNTQPSESTPDPWPHVSVNLPIHLWFLPFPAFLFFVCIYFNISEALFSLFIV